MSQVALPQMSVFAQLLKQGWGQAAAVNSLGCGGGKPLSASRTQSVTNICLQPITTWLMLKLLKGPPNLYKEAQSLTCQHVTGHLTDQSRDQFEQVFAAHRKSTGLNKVKVVMIVYECGQKPFVEKD